MSTGSSVVLVAHDGGGQVRGERAGQHRQPAMGALLLQAKQLMAPLDRRADGGAVVVRSAAEPAQAAGVGGHLRRDVVQRVAQRPGGRQFEG